MILTEDGILMEVSDEHSQKALFLSILSTDEGLSKLIVVRNRHPRNYPFPIISTEDGLFIVAKFEF